MKAKFKALIFTAVMLSGCSSFRMVGDLNMISTRNVDSKADYVLIKTGTDDSKNNLKKYKASTVDIAINNFVISVPGGEFLKNAKLYTDGKSFAIVGDVWGITEAANVEGFRIGDVVLIKNSILKKDKFSKGEITGFKDRKTCIIKTDTGEMKEVSYSELSKATN
jgi:hypothetical protein